MLVWASPKDMTEAKFNFPKRSTGLLASKFLERRVPLRGRITNQLASCCIARLLVLATEDRQRPIVTYIESQGGSVSESLNVISTMTGIHSPVVTFCRGQIGGVAAAIAAHGLKGFRATDPGSRFSLRLQGDTTASTRSTHESYLKLLVQVLSADTGQAEATVSRWLTDGAEFSPQQAMELGLIDAIARAPLLPSVA